MKILIDQQENERTNLIDKLDRLLSQPNNQNLSKKQFEKDKYNFIYQADDDETSSNLCSIIS
jgi:hypothetical protein